MPNYREAAGLPSGGIESGGSVNSGRFVIEGTLLAPGAVVKTRTALPLDANGGGIGEYGVPNGIDSGAIRVDRVGGMNREFSQ